MMYAYDQTLLNKARTSMAWMFDYAVNDVGLLLSIFYQYFLNSSVCRKIQVGDSRIVAGMSGVEMAWTVFEENNLEIDLPKPEYPLEKSAEYWVGWAISYYQWNRNISFADITEKISIDDIRDMYKKYHEIDIKQFVDAVDLVIESDKDEARLSRLRKYARLSQSQLAQKSDVPLRTIQQYEQRQKNINKASFDTIVKLSKALYCKPEELLENSD